jgi:hypothetical protein
MWSPLWSDYDAIAEQIGCTDVCYSVDILMYHGCTDCNCGFAPQGDVMYGDYSGCASLGDSIKSWELACIPTDGC